MLKDITYIGVDIARSKFDICLYNGNFSNCVYESYSNNFDGFFDFFSLLESVNHLENIRIGLEATSVYMAELQKYMDKNKIKYIVINPKKIFHFKKYKNFENKTDKEDSFYIADYITTLKDEDFNSSHSQIQYLYKGYQSSINFISQSETHIKALNDSVLRDSFVSPTLKTKMMNLNDLLVKTKNELLIEHLQIIKISMPEFDMIKSDLVGVSDMTLLAVLPVIYDISDKYSVKQLQSFIGLNPVYNDSGSSLHKKQKISKSGNKEVRKMLYMSSLSAIQHDSFMKLKYQRLLENGKPRKVALVAISAHIFRAIVSRLNHYKGLNK